MQEQEPCLIPALRFHEIIHIILQQKQLAGGTPFDLELMIPHRQVLLPDGIRADVMGALHTVKNIIALGRTFDILLHRIRRIIGHIKGLIRMLLHMLVVGDLLQAHQPIFLAPERALGRTAGIN